MKQIVLIAVFMIAAPNAFGAALTTFASASGINGVSMSVWIYGLLLGITATFSSWLILGGLTGWVNGQVNPMQLFFVVIRATLLVLAAHWMVNMFNGLG